MGITTGLHRRTLLRVSTQRIFPTYCAGQAYLMPASTLKQIYRISSDNKYFHLEDIFITGFCRTVANIRFVSIPGVKSSNYGLSECDMQEALNIHRVSPIEMQQIWEVANTSTNDNCGRFHLPLSSGHGFISVTVVGICILYSMQLLRRKIRMDYLSKCRHRC